MVKHDKHDKYEECFERNKHKAAEVELRIALGEEPAGGVRWEWNKDSPQLNMFNDLAVLDEFSDEQYYDYDIDTHALRIIIDKLRHIHN